MKKDFLKYIVLSLTLVLLTGCGDFLEESSQDNDYVRSWKDLNELLLGGCYMEVNPTAGYAAFVVESNKGMFLHLLADEVEENNFGDRHFDNHEREFAYLTWQQRTGMKETFNGFFTENNTWTQIYKNINVANNILKSVVDVPVTLDSEKEGATRVSGEAHFLRGFYYFWLVNLYGNPYDPNTASKDLGVPIKTSELVEDQKFTRNTVQEAYDLILSDLLTAEEELAQVTKPRHSMYRADVTSVRLLLSRVYLYMQNWEKAAEYARKVIAAHPTLMNMTENTDYFSTKANPENIFSMGGDDLVSIIDPAFQALRVSKEQYAQYSSNDLRRERWFWTYGSFAGLTKRRANFEMSSVTYPKTDIQYYHTYYSYYTTAEADVSSLFWLRSGEAYLNLAEAEAYMGHDTEALQALNTLRNARFYKDAKDRVVTATGSELISAIRKERRLELVLEGHRWFDLRRYRVCKVQPEKKSITHNYTLYKDRGSADFIETRQYVLTEDDESWTLPIPQEVLDFNTGMPNNPNKWRDYVVVPTEE